MRLASVGRWFWVVLVVILVPGCGDDGTSPPLAPVESFREVYQGRYVGSGQGDRGSLVLDVVFTGSRVTGEIVIRSHVLLVQLQYV